MFNYDHGVWRFAHPYKINLTKRDVMAVIPNRDALVESLRIALAKIQGITHHAYRQSDDLDTDAVDQIHLIASEALTSSTLPIPKPA